jgi:FtsZ-binding cell division protein ZapB
MEYKIKIYEKGKVRTRTVFVERVPYKVYEIAQRLERLIASVEDGVSTIQALKKENDELREKRPEEWKDRVKENTYEIKEIEKEILGVEDAGFFKERFEAIRIILELNGIKEGDELLSMETWTDKMDYSDPMAFITFALQKDLDKKKLLTQVQRSTSGV